MSGQRSDGDADDTGWHALTEARRVDRSARVPFRVQHEGEALEAGSVARANLPALSPWAGAALTIDDHGVLLTLPADERNAFFAESSARLHRDGLIRGWRDETYPVLAWQRGLLLATFERAASRFWGTLTFGAHCNGYVADAAGRPQALWLARRALTKPTDPGLLDNLIGGGVPQGQSPGQALLREAWEEAGLRPGQLRGLQPGRVLGLLRDIPEGLQHEWLSVYDLALPPEVTPSNQDGEVGELMLLPVAEALALAATDQMTIDAGLVTLDFALRHRLLPLHRHMPLLAGLERLRQGQAELPAADDPAWRDAAG